MPYLHVEIQRETGEIRLIGGGAPVLTSSQNGDLNMWTMDNTEGHSQAELNAANAIIATIRGENENIAEQNISDALTNSYVDGISSADWEAATRKQLGIH